MSRVGTPGYRSEDVFPVCGAPGQPLALLIPTRSCWLMPPRGPLRVPSPAPAPKFAGRRLRLGRSTRLKRAACQYPPARVTCASPWSRAARVSGPDRGSPRRFGRSSNPTQRVLSPDTDNVSSARRRRLSAPSEFSETCSELCSEPCSEPCSSSSRGVRSVRGARTRGASSPSPPAGSHSSSTSSSDSKPISSASSAAIRASTSASSTSLSSGVGA